MPVRKIEKPTRSRLVTKELCKISTANTQSQITDLINKIFKNSDLLEEQSEVSKAYWQAAEKLDKDFSW